MPYIQDMATARTKGRSKSSARKGRSARLEARITPAQKRLIERAAAYEGRSVSDFVVQTLASTAATVVERHEVIRLNAAETKAFLEALMNPPPPNAALRRAFRDWKKSVDSR